MPTSTGRRNMYIYHLDAGEYIRVRGVDFATGAKQFVLSAAATGSATLTLRIDGVDGDAIATLALKSTGNVEKYKEFKAKVTAAAKGVHDLYLCIDQTEGDVRLDWWKFNQ